jgi:hypothetical protein
MERLTEPKDGEPIDAKALEQQLFEAEQAASDAPTRDTRALDVLCELHQTLLDYRRAAEGLHHAAKTIIRDMEELQRYLGKYGQPSNPLGALQARGPELDRLCGEMACQRQALTRMIRVANAALDGRKD